MAFSSAVPGTGLQGLLQGLQTGGNLMHQISTAKYNNSLHPSGDVANALFVEQLKKQYGESDSRYLQAKAAHDMALAGHQSLIDYRDVLNQTAGIRFSSPLGKIIAEGKGRGAQDILNNGKRLPGTENAPPNSKYKVGEQYYDQEGNPVYDTNPRTPDEKKAYEQAIAKSTTDTAIRNQIPFAKNVEITLDSINPDDLVQFSGPEGTLKLGIETIKAGFGNPSQEFINYQNALTSSKMAAKQLRQFWKDSIQPSATDAIKELTNPTHWTKNPEVARQQFEQLKAVTKQELQTFREAGTSPIKLNYDKESGNFYTTNNKSNSNKNAEVKNSAEDEKLLKSWGAQLIKINPTYTSENITSTAKEMNLTIGQVIDRLLAKGK